MSKDKSPCSDSDKSPNLADNIVYFPVNYPPTQPDDDTTDLIELFLTLWKRRKWIITISLLGLIGAVAYLVGWSFLGKKTYETEVVYRIIYGDASKLNGYLRTREFLAYFVKNEKLAPLILADIYDESDDTYHLPEGAESKFSPEELAAIRLMGNEKNPTFHLGEQDSEYKTLLVQFSESGLTARLANRVLYWFEVYNRDNLLQIAETELQLLRQTSKRLGLEKLIKIGSASTPKIDSGTVAKLQERLIYKEMELELIERINPQSLELPPLIAEVETIQKKLSAIEANPQQSVDGEAETVSGLRIQLARLETHSSRLKDTDKPLLEIVDSAVVPLEPNNSPKAALILALCGIMGCFGSILLVFFLNFIEKVREQYSNKVAVDSNLILETKE